MAEYWNIGRKQPGDERLLVLGTQTRLRGYAYGGQARAPPVCLVPFIWSKYFSAVVLEG